MKFIQYILNFLGFLLLLFPILMQAQSWGGSRGGGSFKDNWSVNINTGITSTFADLSRYDNDLKNKITEESKFAGGLVVQKFFNNKFGIAGQLIYGGLKGENSRQGDRKKFFDCRLIEYNFMGRVNMVNLIRPDYDNKFGLDLYAGIGQFLFKTTYWGLVDSTGSNGEVIRDTGVPEFVYFFGGTAQYRVTDNIGITLDFALRQAQNDYIDNYNDFPVEGTYDYYTFSAIGLTYYFTSGNNRRGGRSKMGAPRKIPIKRRRR